MKQHLEARQESIDVAYLAVTGERLLDHYLQDLVRRIDTGLPDLPFAERQAQQEMMNSYRQQMRDIMAKHA